MIPLNAKIVILTGAGISAESGIETFRAEDGLWAQHRVEDVATPEGFARDPELVVNFYNARRAQAAEAEPNAAHQALAELEKKHRGEVVLITQNVDDLHERGGSEVVMHMHGHLKGALCAACDHRWPAPMVMAAGDACPACAFTTILAYHACLGLYTQVLLKSVCQNTHFKRTWVYSSVRL